MSAFMTCNSETEVWGNALLRFLNTDMCGYRTHALLDKVWPYEPWASNYSHSRDDHLAWQVGRLCRLMLIMNRRAIWHRYSKGRKPRDRHDVPSWAQTRINKLRGDHYPTPPDSERIAIAKYLSCTIYQCAEFNAEPRNYTLLCRFEQALDCDVFHSIKVWNDAPWGRFSSHIAK